MPTTVQMLASYPDHWTMLTEGVQRSPRLHLYKLIRERTPCKAYFDLESVQPTSQLAHGIREGLPAVVQACILKTWHHTAMGDQITLEVLLLEGS